MTLLAIVVLASISQAVGILCKNGMCRLQVVKCSDQPDACRATNRGQSVMDQLQATAMCSNVGMRLATPGDDIVNAQMHAMCPSAAFFDVVAIQDQPCNKFVVRSTGEELNYTKWLSGEPNNMLSPGSGAGCSRGEPIETCVGFAFGTDTPNAWHDRVCNSSSVNPADLASLVPVMCVVCAFSHITQPTRTTTATPMRPEPIPLPLSLPTQDDITTTTKGPTSDFEVESQPETVTDTNYTGNNPNINASPSQATPTSDTVAIIVVVACVLVCVLVWGIVGGILIARRRQQSTEDEEEEDPEPGIEAIETPEADERAIDDVPDYVVGNSTNSRPSIYGNAEFIKPYLPLPLPEEVFDMSTTMVIAAQDHTYRSCQPTPRGEYDRGQLTID